MTAYRNGIVIADCTGEAARRGHLDAAIGKSCDPRGRFIQYPNMPESDWPAFRDAYNKAYEDECKAHLWRDALEQGAILTFEANDGAVVVAGPYIKAVGARTFLGTRYGGGSRWRGERESRTAWDLALWIIQQVGRKRPVRMVF